MWSPAELEVRSVESVAALAEVAGDAEIVFNNVGILLPAPLLTATSSASP